eukprot:Hpha_TRINITY_DN15702_c1_g2::TRINITY_DN15702_c1_g2_i1::g.37885::m.37885
MGGKAMGLKTWCSFQWLVREGDSAEDARARTLLFPFCIVISVVLILSIITTLRDTMQLVRVMGLAIIVFGAFAYIAGITSNTFSVFNLLDMFLILCAVGICLLDLAEATISSPNRGWTYAVLVLDGGLMFNHEHVPKYVIPALIAYITAVELESSERFGLYEWGYWGTEGVEISNCNCPSPPCGQPLGRSLLRIAGVCIVVLGDFYFTRGFASGLRLQLRRVEASVEVATDIADALAKYDIDKAEKAIDMGKDLPVELAGSFRGLLTNLRSYRDYIPEALLHNDDTGDSAVPPPVNIGESDVHVGMVFTDIQSSTAL